MHRDAMELAGRGPRALSSLRSGTNARTSAPVVWRPLASPVRVFLRSPGGTGQGRDSAAVAEAELQAARSAGRTSSRSPGGGVAPIRWGLERWVCGEEAVVAFLGRW